MDKVNGVEYCGYTVKYYSAIKKNEILSLVATWTNLNDIMLSKIIQAQKEKKKSTLSPSYVKTRKVELL